MTEENEHHHHNDKQTDGLSDHELLEAKHYLSSLKIGDPVDLPKAVELQKKVNEAEEERSDMRGWNKPSFDYLESPTHCIDNVVFHSAVFGGVSGLLIGMSKQVLKSPLLNENPRPLYNFVQNIRFGVPFAIPVAIGAATYTGISCSLRTNFFVPRNQAEGIGCFVAATTTLTLMNIFVKRNRALPNILGWSLAASAVPFISFTVLDLFRDINKEGYPQAKTFPQPNPQTG